MGSAATSSVSISPVMETEAKVRYAAITSVKAPDEHSARKSVRSVEVGVISVAMEERASHSFFALMMG